MQGQRKDRRISFSRTYRNFFKAQFLSVLLKNFKTVTRYSNWYYVLPTVCHTIYGWLWLKNFRRHKTAATHMVEVYLWYIVWYHKSYWILNAFHHTIEFNAEWSKEEINILDVNVRLRNRQLETDLHNKLTDTRISYSQDLRYNRICSDNEKCYQRCSNLEKWLMERGYSKRMVRQQIFKAKRWI